MRVIDLLSIFNIQPPGVPLNMHIEYYKSREYKSTSTEVILETKFQIYVNAEFVIDKGRVIRR